MADDDDLAARCAQLERELAEAKQARLKWAWGDYDAMVALRAQLIALCNDWDQHLVCDGAPEDAQEACAFELRALLAANPPNTV